LGFPEDTEKGAKKIKQNRRQRLQEFRKLQRQNLME
jgi:hypothetical protein